MSQYPSALDEEQLGRKSCLNVLVLCILMYPPHAGGAEIQAYYVSNKLAEWGHNVHVISTGPTNQAEDQDKTLFKQSFIRYKWGRFPGNFAFVLKMFSLGYLLRDKIDVVQVHIADMHMVSAFLLSKIANKPYVVTCHGSDIRILRRSTFGKFLKKAMLKNASKVVSISKEIKDILVNEYGLPSQSIKIITNGYDEEWMKRRLDETSNNAPRENPSLVFVGSLREVKDPLNAVEVFKIVSGPVKNVNLQIVGEGPLRQAVERKIEKYGLQDRVTLHGAVSHQRALEILASSAIYVLTSVEEGLPTSLIEAMALGKPVAATSVGGVPEIVSDGVNGLLTPPRLPEKMAQLIERLLKDPVLAKKLGKAAAESVKDFSWNNIAREYLNVYLEVSRQSSGSIKLANAPVAPYAVCKLRMS
jgi:glycosyltransferase involved in cell wall biosynthesis